MSIVTFTANPAVDVSTQVDRIVAGHKLRCGPERRDAGGGGINVARVLKRFDEPCVAIFPAGGPIGALLKDLVSAEGVAHDIVPIAGNTREDVTVIERSSGQEFRFVMPGPTLSSLESETCLAVLESHFVVGGIVVASGSLPPGLAADFYAKLARNVVRREARFVLDSSGPALAAALGPELYLVKPSKRELCDLSGVALENQQSCLAECRRLIARQAAQLVALSLGDEGALLVGKDFAFSARAPRVETISSVGAGDSFLAVLVMALSRDKAPAEALKLAVAAGSAALLSPGTGLCRVSDVMRLAETIEVVVL